MLMHICFYDGHCAKICDLVQIDTNFFIINPPTQNVQLTVVTAVIMRFVFFEYGDKSTPPEAAIPKRLTYVCPEYNPAA